MNWEAIGATDEILGALAVVATLVYLSVQVRQNSKLAKAAIQENRTHSSGKCIFALSEAADTLVKSDQRIELAAGESMRMQLLQRAVYMSI